MAWKPMLLRGKSVYARATPEGQLETRAGKVEIRYQLPNGKAYFALAANLEVDPEGKAPPASERPAVDKPPKAGWVRAYADGSSLGNPGPAGLGVVIQAEEREIEIAEHLGRATNNVAELMAIQRAAERAFELGAALELHTDSQYSIGVLSKGWKPKANQALIAEVKTALKALPAHSLHYVRGHAGIPLNERADELARRAAQGSTQPTAERR